MEKREADGGIFSASNNRDYNRTGKDSTGENRISQDR